MTGWTGTRLMRSTVGLLLITGLVVAQGLQAAALRSCPHHGASMHPGSEALHPGSAAEHPRSGVAPDHGGLPPAEPAGHESEAPEPASHDGPCDCLGPCGASATVHVPPPAEAAFSQVAPRRIASAGQSYLPATLRAVPFALPFANAPPA